MSNVHAALRNLKVKDTPKIQNALHERRFMRGFEEKRETLIIKIGEDTLVLIARRNANRGPGSRPLRL
jgi:hypothetical protein